MKRLILYSASAIMLLCFMQLRVADKPVGQENTTTYFRQHAKDFAASVAELEIAVNRIDPKNVKSVATAKQGLLRCRIEYKSIQFFLEYFFYAHALLYNEPAKLEVEDPFIEYDEPRGFQVIETVLFDKITPEKKDEMQQQVRLIKTSADDLPALLYNFTCSDAQLLESVRLELIRVCTLTITGYDAPLLKSGIIESAASLIAVRDNLKPFLQSGDPREEKISGYLAQGIAYLQTHPDFDTFNRMVFLTNIALPLQKELGLWIKERGLELNTVPALNYNAANIFSRDAFNEQAFTRSPANPQLAALGKELFFENALSANNKRSCASCHHPEKYFTDGLPKSMALDGHTPISRNAPTLLYSAFQYRQFWDGRSATLQEQIRDVLANTSEMSLSIADVPARIRNKPALQAALKTAYPNDQSPQVSIDVIADAIAAYLQSLKPFSSPFDQYMGGNKLAMRGEQIKGFNLFMGKAQCATCHFAPVFNGLIPPLYSRTEFEVLGTPATSNFRKPVADKDQGRFPILQAEPYMRAFKTPTVRNASKTAPYMHNGAFGTMEVVMDFYNKGGGNGIGLNLENQTLSAVPLNLTDAEIKQVIKFIDALTDKPLNN